MPKRKVANEEPDWENMTRKQRRRARRQQNRENRENQDNAERNPDGRKRVDKWVPDSSLGDDEFYNQAQFFLDDARLDPANDPTLQPMIDAIQRESLQDYKNSVANLQLQAEGGSRFGRDYYMAALGRSNEQYNEGMQSTLANVYFGAREGALNNRMQMLGLGNQRDIAAGQLKVQHEGDVLSHRSAMAGVAAQRAALNFERQKWNEEAPLRYLTAMSGFIGDMNQMGGYELSPGYIPDAPPANTMSGGAIAAASLANGVNAYMGAGGTFGSRGISAPTQQQGGYIKGSLFGQGGN